MVLSRLPAPYYDHQQSVTSNLLRYIVTASALLFPVLMAVRDGAASGIFLLLSLLGFGVLWQDWKRLRRGEKQIFTWLLAFVAFAALSLFWADDPDTGLKRFEKVLRFALVVPCYLLVRRYSHETLKGFVAGLVLAGPVLVLGGHLSQVDGRAAGAYNSVLFGDFSILVAATTFTLGALMGGRFWGWRLLLMLSSVLASYAGFLSMTRGAWIALPIALAFTGIALLVRYQGAKRWIIVGLLALAASGAAAWLVNSSSFQGQLARSIQNVQRFAEGEVSTSIGLRVVLWQAAVEHWKASPVLGSGLGDFGADTVALIERNEQFAPISHLAREEAHSLYFEHLAALGGLGLLLLVGAIFLKPALELFKPTVAAKHIQAVRLAALVLLVVFSVYGISQNWLARSSVTAAYLMFFSVLLSAFFQKVGFKGESVGKGGAAPGIDETSARLGRSGKAGAV